MQVYPVRTDIVKSGDRLADILDKSLPPLTENSVVAVTSKIVSICEGRMVPNDGSVDKRTLIHEEADQYLEDPEYYDKYHISLTVKDSHLIASSGIDESNGNGYFILWPENPQASAVGIWNYIRSRYHLKNLGVIITDSHTTPLRWGVTGVGLGWCGFKALKPYIGKPDLFGRSFKFVNGSVIDGLAAAAVLVMGEGSEQTPLAVISDLTFVEFSDTPPADTDVKKMKIALEDDIYAPLLSNAGWKKGKRG
jgi:putative folate metabolism gamma-glutamate ligase